ncbi:MAG: S-methyl-5'-thioadenosine phosphorylase [Anaerolinea thermophila]|uniref:S-methyl-5'-thioadenosine phosphorylase n=1 Tax=Anaerolinea thermophila TaxID=167964 RepID=A0A117LGM6_9CHLR|nr:MAG: S-methyl-5'-thioadenosine phosphorylase [Anaerolinea thermophila]
MIETPILAVIGGSGLYNFKDLTDIETIEFDTPFGKPSAPITLGNLMGKPVAFLARHGIGHTYSPSEVPYRANIFALKKLGVKRIVSVSACGSLREAYAPGTIIIPNQIFDFTHKRERSFFGEGLVAHVSVADPFCENLSNILESAVKKTEARFHRGGTYITIEGPRFSTKGESNLYRQWGIDIIGMTASPEAFLAREAEICYTTMAHVTDYDVWHVIEDTVTVDMVIRTLSKNISLAQEAIKNMVAMIDETAECDCQNALQNAIITNRDHIDPAKQVQIKLLIEKYLD